MVVSTHLPVKFAEFDNAKRNSHYKIEMFPQIFIKENSSFEGFFREKVSKLAQNSHYEK